MRKSQFTEEQKIVVVQQAAAGTPVRELCRKHGITETTFYYVLPVAREVRRIPGL